MLLRQPIDECHHPGQRSFYFFAIFHMAVTL
jgi:hypothetical protein